MEKVFYYLMSEHRGKVIGVLLGLLASILFISYGFWRTLFIVFCILAGYFIGKKIDENTNLEVWIKNLFKQNP
ncbi:MAG TPA: DUF2273 domain-containing protein [Syntrophomonas sp.]|nr:DUF2273 domain-containing protein [Syntrophomonas sp.]HRW12384.1 DUF2273 domain-containing protein [Syntrophomonas sp.]